MENFHLPEGRVCPENYFHCWQNQRCVEDRKKCDGHHDCLDLDKGYRGSDEAICSCNEDEFLCEEDGSCILQRYRCDKQKDCPRVRSQKYSNLLFLRQK